MSTIQEKGRIANDQLDAIADLFTPSGMFTDVNELKRKMDKEMEATDAIHRTRTSIVSMIQCIEESHDRIETSKVVSFPDLLNAIEKSLNELYEIEQHLFDKEGKQQSKYDEAKDKFYTVCKENNNTFDNIKGILNITEKESD